MEQSCYMKLYSKEFDDVYFSVDDGLAESRYVFLQGNDLPDAWAGKNNFTICETGFGTGLNFLAVLKLWRETDAGQRPDNLHFISFEKYPLDRDVIKGALSHWTELGGELAKLIAIYPVDLKGGVFKLPVIDGVELSLIFGDVNDELPKLNAFVNCWFLDGFRPSTNPDMWSDILFENMARLSSKDASFATFTAAGFVRRTLMAQNFEVRKIKGFGCKREMLVGSYNKGGNKCE